MQIYGDNVTVGGPSPDDRNYFGLGFGLRGSQSANITFDNNVMGFSTDFSNYFGPVTFGALYNEVHGLIVKDNYFQNANFVSNWSGNRDFVFTGNKICVNPALTTNVCVGQSGTGVSLFGVDNVTIGGPNLNDRNYISSGLTTGQNLINLASHGSSSNIRIENNFLDIDQSGLQLLQNRSEGSDIWVVADGAGSGVNVHNNTLAGSIGVGGNPELTNVDGNNLGVGVDKSTVLSQTNQTAISTYFYNVVQTTNCIVNIKNNVQTNANQPGGFGYHAGADPSSAPCTYTIDSNKFSKNYSNIYPQLDPNQNNTVVISNNIADNAGGTNIRVESGPASVFGNTATNSGLDGAGDAISLPLGSLAHNNIIDNCPSSGISAGADIEIYNNTITNCVHGLNLYGGNINVHDNEISSSNDKAIYLRNISGGTVNRNNIHNNGYGIYAQDLVRDVSITENAIKNNSNNGVAYSSLSNLTILKNVVFNNGGLGIDADYNNSEFNDIGDTDNNVNFPIVRFIVEGGTSSLGGVTPSATDTAVYFDVDLKPGDYRFDICNNPSGQDASGFGECEVWLGSVNANIASAGRQRLSLTIPGTGYEFGKLSMQATKRNALTDTLSQSSEFGPAQVAQANLVVFAQVHNLSGYKIEPFPRVNEGSNLTAPSDKYLATVVCNSNNSVDPDFARDDVTSFHLTTTLAKASFVSYQVRSENSSATTLGSIDQNGNWTGRLKLGECLNIAVNSTVTGNNGQFIDFTSTLTSSGLDGGLANVDPDSSDDTYTIAVPINGEPDLALTSTQKTPGPITPGMDVEYEIRVSNIGNGSSNADGFNFYVLIPDGATFNPATGFTITTGPAALVGCSDLGEASTVTPGLAQYRGHVIGCSLNRSDFLSGETDTYKLIITSSNSFISGTTKSIAVVTANDEPDSTTFFGVFGSGGDGLALNLNNINRLTYDDTPLTVTINRSSETPAQTDVDDACFIVEFNKPIWADSFTQDSLTVVGQGNIYLFSQIDDQHWKVCVNGMKKGETVTLTMDANKVQDMSAILNGAQVLGENTVRYAVQGSNTNANSSVTNLGTTTGRASANGVLAATGASYLWLQFWSALILLVFGIVLLNLNSKKLCVLRFATRYRGFKS